MPILGETKRGWELGYKSKKNKWIWSACIDCGKERWIMPQHPSPRCHSCANRIITGGLSAEKSHNWKGGRHKSSFGYIEVYCDPNSPFASMRNSDHILEHRLIMAQYLGRPLSKVEVVHHKNGIKDDNRLENLYLCDKTEHSVVLSKEIAKLHKEVIRLEERMKKLEEAEL